MTLRGGALMAAPNLNRVIGGSSSAVLSKSFHVEGPGNSGRMNSIASGAAFSAI
jgi:hypothetical protein